MNEHHYFLLSFFFASHDIVRIILLFFFNITYCTHNDVKGEREMMMCPVNKSIRETKAWNWTWNNFHSSNKDQRIAAMMIIKRKLRSLTQKSLLAFGKCVFLSSSITLMIKSVSIVFKRALLFVWLSVANCLLIFQLVKFIFVHFINLPLFFVWKRFNWDICLFFNHFIYGTCFRKKMINGVFMNDKK